MTRETALEVGTGAAVVAVLVALLALAITLAPVREATGVGAGPALLEALEDGRRAHPISSHPCALGCATTCCERCQVKDRCCCRDRDRCACPKDPTRR